MILDAKVLLFLDCNFMSNMFTDMKLEKLHFKRKSLIIVASSTSRDGSSNCQQPLLNSYASVEVLPRLILLP